MNAFMFTCILLAYALFATAQSGGANTLGQIKRWRLPTPHGEVGIKLSSAPGAGGSHTVLSLDPDGNSVPTAREEADLLRPVLTEMSSLQYDPKNMEMISTWLQNSEYRDGVAGAVFQSGKWKSCSGFKYCHQAEGVADQYLSSIDAFKEFNTILHEYGLRIKAVRVDDMATATKAGKLLCEGLLVISLEKEK
jgi:hypothetical protein